MTHLLLTCEHASREIPPQFSNIFANFQSLLATHRGYDIGAVPIYQQLVSEFNCPSFKGEWSRLLCDLNRSPNHKVCLSEITRVLPKQSRQDIIQQFHQPYHEKVIQQISAMQNHSSDILHIGVHSFTPELHGQIRNADIGLLYDPKRSSEKEFCLRWKKALHKAAPDLRIRMNYPYLGIGDGLCQILRKKFKDSYAGIELEMNQALTSNPHNSQRLQTLMIETLQSIL